MRFASSFNTAFSLILFKLQYVAQLSDKELFYRGADKSLARPTSRCIFFDGENTSFDASLILYRISQNYVNT